MKLEIVRADGGKIEYSDVQAFVRGVDGTLFVCRRWFLRTFDMTHHDILRSPDEETRRVIAGGQWDEVR